MVYIDENGTVLDSVDLKRGFLVDEEWIDHPEKPQEGHFEYEELQGGGRMQRYVVDAPYQPAHREVTVQRYVPYTEEEMEILGRGDGYGVRISALEEKTQEHDGALSALIGGAQDA